MEPPNVHLLVNTQIQIKSEAIVARLVALNCLRAKPSFIQDADGHRFMLQQLTMQ
jgi:hypothetical protein